MTERIKSREELIIELEELKQEYKLLKASNKKDKLEQGKIDGVLLSIKLAIQNSKEVIFLTDKEGLITFINPEFSKIYGYAAEEVIGKKTPRILYSGFYNNKRDFEAFWETLNNKQSIPATQYLNKDKEGKLIMIEGSADPIINDEGEIIGFLGIQRDITERKKSEDALKESELKLRELNATKDKFFSIIAHDLKGPFSTILGFSELLKNNFEEYDRETQKNFIGLLNESAANTYRLLENLLTWASSQRGTINFNPGKENLFLLSDETIRFLSQLATNKSIKIVNEISDEIFVSADKDMLSAVIRNLVSNAIKFTPRNGEIKLSVQIIRDENNNEMAEIWVKDRGIGIKSQFQSKLFSITENITAKGTEDEMGTGLGLILCKEFVEKHGGKIWVESTEGMGSSFVFTLPVKM